MRCIVALCMLIVLLPDLHAQEEEPEYFIFSIYFGGGSYYIDQEQSQELSKWLEDIPNLDMHSISIHGHTDDIGSMEYNKRLSQMRCLSAKEKLLFNGIPSEQISIAEFGEENPVYDNSTWEGKLKNRRVDIIIERLAL